MTVKQCPAVEWIFDITWDPVNESIVWKYRDEPLTPQYRKKAAMEKPIPENAAINTTDAETLQQLEEYQQYSNTADILDSGSPIEQAVIMHLTQPSLISLKNTPTVTTDDIAAELMLDIEEEEDLSTNKSFKNRFILVS